MTLQLAWMDSAKCATVGDSDLWFPEHGGPNRQAKAVCAACVVAAECASYAKETKAYGIWSGQLLVDGRYADR